MCVECSSHMANTKPIVNLIQSCLKWSKLSDADNDRYHYNTENYFRTFSLDMDLLLCKDASCKSSDHKRKIDNLYGNFVNGLAQSSKYFVQIHKHSENQKPGWNDICKEAYSQKREAFLMWKDSGKPKSGPVFAIYNKVRANFTYFLHYCKLQELQL